MAGARRHSIQWGFISLCHPGHSPLTQLSAPPLSGAPSLGFLNLPPQDWCIPAGHSAWVVPPTLPSSTTRGRKRQKNAAKAFDHEEHNVSVDDGGVDVMLTCH